MTKFLSGKIKKRASTQVDPNRHSYFNLSDIEVDLGIPSANGYVLSSDISGNRSWIDPTNLGRDGLSAVQNAASGGGTLTYDSANGVFTYTPPDLSSFLTVETDPVYLSEKGQPLGTATLDASGLVPSSQLPSYVDDVLSYPTFGSFPATGETGKIYVDQATGDIFRWDGAATYIQINDAVTSADQATQLATARDFSLTGDVTATAVSFNGTANVALSTSISLSGVTQHLSVVTTAPGSPSLSFDSSNGVFTYTPPSDNDTLYDIALSDGTNAGEVDIDLNAGGSGSGTDTVTLKEGSNITLTRSGDVVTISSSATAGSTYDLLSIDDANTGIIRLSGSDGANDDIVVYGLDATTVSSNTSGVYISSTDTNDFLTALSFDTANGVLTATVSNQSDVTVDLDGRYLQNVVEDTTPQLGGNLDTNGFDIAPADTSNNAQTDTLTIHAKNSTNSLPTDGGGNLVLRGGYGYGGGDATVIGGAATDASGIAGDVIISGGERDGFPYQGDVKIQGLTYPSSDGTNGQVLTTDGSGNLSFADSASTVESINDLSDVDTTGITNGQLLAWDSVNSVFTPIDASSNGLQNVVEDTTPQLGGNLDLNSSDITGTGNINTTGTLTVSGNATIGGDLIVNGTTTTINSTTLEVDDLNITVASGAANAAAADGAGLTVDGANATITYDATNDRWTANKDFAINVVGNIDGDVTGDIFTPYNARTFTVTVATKDSTHPEFNNGSTDGYKIDGTFSPFLRLIPGVTYTFDQSDASNAGHPLAFYYDANKTTSYTTGVTNNGTPGSAGATTTIVVSNDTPSTLYYQCGNHALMGWGVEVASHNLTGLTTDTLDEGLTNLYYTDARVDTYINNSINTDDISEGSTNLYFNQTRARQSISVEANTALSYDNTTGVIGFDDSAYLTSETYSDANSLLVAIKTVDGIGSGLDADLLDGQQSSYYLDYNNFTSVPTSILNFGITDGTAGQVLQTDGSGNFSFTTVSGAGGGAGTGYAGYEDYYFNVSSETSTFGTASNTHDKVQVYVNGVMLDDSDFSFVESTGIVTLTDPAINGDQVTIWGFNSTNLDNHELFSVDSSGNITAPGTIQIGNHRKEGSLTSTIASTSPTNVVMYASADYVGSKLIITVKDNETQDTQITEALILTVNGGTPKITTYGTMHTSTNALASFDVANVSTNTALEVTMVSTNSSTIKVAYTLIDV